MNLKLKILIVDIDSYDIRELKNKLLSKYSSFNFSSLHFNSLKS